MDEITFATYKAFGGSTIRSEEEFTPICRRAVILLKGSGVRLPEAPSADEAEAITLCVCEICDVLYVSSESAGLASESVDGWSRVFREKKGAETQGEILGIIYRRLARFTALRRATVLW